MNCWLSQSGSCSDSCMVMACFSFDQVGSKDTFHNHQIFAIKYLVQVKKNRFSPSIFSRYSVPTKGGDRKTSSCVVCFVAVMFLKAHMYACARTHTHTHTPKQNRKALIWVIFILGETIFQPGYSEFLKESSKIGVSSRHHYLKCTL